LQRFETHPGRSHGQQTFRDKIANVGELITDLDTIKRLAEQEDDDNWEFRTFLKCHDWSNPKLDKLVHEINDRVSSQIDCTKCGNCCRSMTVQLTKADVTRLANRLRVTGSEFTGRYTVKNGEGETVIETLPCPFLADGLCTVYDDRPQDCRDFPNLHKKDFRSRLMGVVMNASVCPIVFNVLRELKREMRWKRRR